LRKVLLSKKRNKFFKISVSTESTVKPQNDNSGKDEFIGIFSIRRFRFIFICEEVFLL
jgi:hypothetical protein